MVISNADWLCHKSNMKTRVLRDHSQQYYLLQDVAARFRQFRYRPARPSGKLGNSLFKIVGRLRALHACNKQSPMHHDLTDLKRQQPGAGKRDNAQFSELQKERPRTSATPML